MALKKISVPIRILRIDNDGFHLQIVVTLNRKRARLLIDTGASRTVFDKSRIHIYTEKKHFEKTPHLSTGFGTDRLETHSTEIKSVKIGTLDIKDFEAILLDLSHVNASYESLGLKPIDGVLGCDILKKYKAVIDMGKKVLKLET